MRVAAVLCAAAAALAGATAQASPRAAVGTSPSVFAGRYADPNHPGCARNVTVFGAAGRVYGADAAGGEGVPCDGKTDVARGPLQATFRKEAAKDLEIVVDFSPKGGPADLAGEWDAKHGAIQWADGNNWTQLPK